MLKKEFERKLIDMGYKKVSGNFENVYEFGPVKIYDDMLQDYVKVRIKVSIKPYEIDRVLEVHYKFRDKVSGWKENISEKYYHIRYWKVILSQIEENTKNIEKVYKGYSYQRKNMLRWKRELILEEYVNKKIKEMNTIFNKITLEKDYEFDGLQFIPSFKFEAEKKSRFFVKIEIYSNDYEKIPLDYEDVMEDKNFPELVKCLEKAQKLFKEIIGKKVILGEL